MGVDWHGDDFSTLKVGDEVWVVARSRWRRLDHESSFCPAMIARETATQLIVELAIDNEPVREHRFRKDRGIRIGDKASYRSFRLVIPTPERQAAINAHKTRKAMDAAIWGAFDCRLHERVSPESAQRVVDLLAELQEEASREQA